MSEQLRAVVCGAGNMGKAIIFSMSKFGFHVIALDRDPDSVRHLPQNLFDFMVTKDHDDITSAIKLSNPHVVISSLPYHQTLDLANFCIYNGYNYCDLGGRVDVSDQINNCAMTYGRKHKTSHCFTDLGLAPGWVNILAEHGVRQLYGRSNEIDSVKMMVGGLPENPSNPPLNYIANWSLDGLLNEYKDDCKIIKNGSVVKVKGMDGLEIVESKSMKKNLEAFYTSGGASHTIRSMSEKNVKECSYKTLRYRGHNSIIKFLIRDCEINEECLLQVFEKSKPNKHNVKDLVIIKVMIQAKDSHWEKELAIPCSNNFSAMQKATAFSISSVAKMMAEDFFNKNAPQHRDYYDFPPKALSYKHVDYDEFMKNINTLRVSDEVMDPPYEPDISSEMATPPEKNEN